MEYGKLASTGLGGVTILGVSFNTPVVAAIGVGLVFIGAVFTRFGFRRGKSIGEG